MKFALFLIAILLFPFQAFAIQGAWVEPLGRTKTVCVVPTIQAAAYSSGNSVGGVLTFAGLFRDATNSGQLVSVRVTDKAGTASDYDFVPLGSALTGGTVADKATPAISDADLASGKVLPMAQLTTLKGFADNGYSQWTGIIPLVSADTSLRAIVTVQDTPTYATTGDVTVCATVWQD